MRSGESRNLPDLYRRHPPCPQPEWPRQPHRLRRRQPAQRNALLLMRRSGDNETRGLCGEDGFTLIEVLVAALVLTLASAALFGVLAASVRNNARAKST